MPPEPRPADPNRINLAWLVRLRWATIAGQLVTIATVRVGMQLPIPIGALLSLVGVEVLVNVACQAAARRVEPAEWWLATVMAADVVIFTGLLYLTGGPVNPFSFLYLVPITLAALTLRGAWTWALVMLSLGCSAVLFVAHRPLPLSGVHEGHMTAHLQGMWVAFGVAAAFIVYFMLRVRHALEAREAELDASRARMAREQRLVSLATLAAGAAHELSTPLSTIAVVAKDLERDLGAGGDPRALEDVRLVRAQVERCRQILSRMRAEAGEAAGEPFAAVTVGDLLRQVTASDETAAPRAPLRAEIDPALAAVPITGPRHALAQALRVLIENAEQASPPGAEVRLSVRSEGPVLRFEICDAGVAIAPEVLARMGEPFFTTKPAGQGMGLGLFLARSVAERLGGGVTFRSVAGEGTTAALSIPAGAPPR